MSARIVSYKHFRDYCRKCEFYEVKGGGYKHYCHLDGTLRICIDSRVQKLKYLKNCNYECKIIDELEKIKKSRDFSNCAAEQQHLHYSLTDADVTEKIMAFVCDFNERLKNSKSCKCYLDIHCKIFIST